MKGVNVKIKLITYFKKIQRLPSFINFTHTHQEIQPNEMRIILNFYNHFSISFSFKLISLISLIIEGIFFTTNIENSGIPFLQVPVILDSCNKIRVWDEISSETSKVSIPFIQSLCCSFWSQVVVHNDSSLGLRT